MYFVLVLISLSLLCVWTYRYKVYWRKKGIPTIKESSLKSSLEILFLRKSIWGHVEELYWRYNNKYTGFFMLNNPSLIVKDIDMIKRILIKDFDYFPDRTLGRNPDADTLGAHILFLTRGHNWKFMRSKVTHAYSTSRINLLIPLMARVAQNLSNYISDHLNEPVEMKETCARYSTDVITTSAYGIDGNSFSEGKDNYRSITALIFPATFGRALAFSVHYVAPFLLKYLGLTFLDKHANKRLEKTYVEQMGKRIASGITKNDFLDFIIQLCNKETDPRFNIGHKAMVSQAAQFFLAGFETIGSIFCYMLYELAKHQDIQARLREEIQNVMKAHESLNTTALKQMTYLDMVLRETMRLYPVLPFLDRKVAKDYKIPDTDITLEKGTNVYISTIGMHYDPKYFPDPHKFDPERFSIENKSTIEPFAYLPFGAGPRICIGGRYGVTTIKVGMVRVMMDFTISSCSETPEKLDYHPGSFVLVPLPDIKVLFNKIQ